MQQVETDGGVNGPETMARNCELPHVFAMDNLDWKKKKTLEGESLNATTAIISLMTSSDGQAGNVLLMCRLSRMITT